MKDLKRNVKALQSEGYSRNEICLKLGIAYYPLDNLIRKWRFEKRQTTYLKVLKLENEYMIRHSESLEDNRKTSKLCRFCLKNQVDYNNDDMCPICQSAFKCVGEETSSETRP